MHFIFFSVSPQNLFVIHFFILWRSPSGETRQTNVHILNTDNADCHKNDSHTQLFNSVLSQAGGSVYLMMTVWVLQAVWPAP